MEETLKGVLERIVYQNEEHLFTIGDFRPDGASAVIAILGNLPGVQCGETLKLSGMWTTHPAHGKQFKFKAFTSELPASVYGIQKYLGSGLIPDVGPKNAKKIVDKFGTDTLRIISEESKRLREIEGIGRKRAQQIKSAWDEQSALREVMVFLQTYGVSTNLALRLIRKYGSQAKYKIENDPYRVAREIRGIGFKTADKIARNLGISNESSQRLEAGIVFSLSELEDNGHTAFPQQQLLEQAAQMLEVDPALLPPRLKALIAEGALINPEFYRSVEDANPEAVSQLASAQIGLDEESDHLLQSRPYFYSEEDIARSLDRIVQTPSILPEIQVDKAIKWAQDNAGFNFAEQQGIGLSMALSSKMGILTGGPGTGKTTILQALVKILKMKRAEVQLAAPTGRAAQRMTETTGAGAKTIHRLLAFDPASGKFTVNENDPLKADFIIVDEASMLDTKLASALFRAISPACHLLLVGDVDQLPSVGSGNVLNDLIKIAEQQKKNGETNSIQVTRLNKIFRQGERSGIVSTAHDILNGVKASPPPIANPSQINTELDLHFIHAPDPERCVKAVTRLCQTLLPNWYPWADRLRDIQVLAPLHKGTAGISNLNRVLQTTLNLQEQVLRMGDKQYHVGDKIIQTRNNYDLNIFNGDLGTILDIQPVSGEMLINFNDEHVQLKRSDLIDITTAYAISIHKSQGSEFPIVVIPLLKQHFIMLQRNLIYTAITRGRKKVFLVGDPAAYAMAVANHSSSKRITDLLPKYTAPYTIAG